MRTCRKCPAPATNDRGVPVCDACRAPAYRPEKERPLRIVTCKQCSREYRTKSGNRLCNQCAHAARKHPCVRCGSPCDLRAVLCLACAGATAISGPKSSNWRGGRTVNKLTGYVRVKVDGHPRGGKQNYVSEHVIVMEGMIGRYLLPGENVHHRNGVRGDNRPENLELWVKSQPAGQRAVDLLAWAREIEATYGSLPLDTGPNPG